MGVHAAIENLFPARFDIAIYPLINHTMPTQQRIHARFEFVEVVKRVDRIQFNVYPLDLRYQRRSDGVSHFSVSFAVLEQLLRHRFNIVE